MEKDMIRELYDRYYGEAILYTTAICQNADLAGDLVADAFVKACIALPKDVSSFRFWLFRVCKNLYIDSLRKQPPQLSETELQQVPDGQTPEIRYLENERYRCLWRAICSLAPVDREIVTLHYFSGLPLPEVAQLVGRTYPAVRQRLVRLRKVLKQRMEEQGYDF